MRLGMNWKILYGAFGEEELNDLGNMEGWDPTF
jgi:hypothetical protein